MAAPSWNVKKENVGLSLHVYTSWKNVNRSIANPPFLEPWEMETNQ